MSPNVPKCPKMSIQTHRCPNGLVVVMDVASWFNGCGIKEHWWQAAYPDPQYQQVVERLWEISMESKDSNNDNFVLLTVNIMTKHHDVKRFKVYTELESALLDGYYVVAFEEVSASDYLS